MFPLSPPSKPSKHPSPRAALQPGEVSTGPGSQTAAPQPPPPDAGEGLNARVCSWSTELPNERKGGERGREEDGKKKKKRLFSASLGTGSRLRNVKAAHTPRNPLHLPLKGWERGGEGGGSALGGGGARTAIFGVKGPRSPLRPPPAGCVPGSLWAVRPGQACGHAGRGRRCTRLCLHTPGVTHCVVPSPVCHRTARGVRVGGDGGEQSVLCAHPDSQSDQHCWCRGAQPHRAHRHHSGGGGLGGGTSPSLTWLSCGIPPSRTSPRALLPFQPYASLRLSETWRGRGGGGGTGPIGAHTAHTAPHTAASPTAPPAAPSLPPSQHTPDPRSPPISPPPPNTCTCQMLSSARPRPPPPRPARSSYGTPGRCGPPRRGRRWRCMAAPASPAHRRRARK